jgi:hypothetical protein
MWRQDDGIWQYGVAIVARRHKWSGGLRPSKVDRRRLVASTLLLSSRPRNAFNLACAGCLQLAQAVSSRLFGILITFPFELGLQAIPLIRIDRLQIGVREFAVGSRLSRKQRGVRMVNAQFSRWLCFGVNSPTRRQANWSCPGLPVSLFEIAVSRAEFAASRIARASD